MSCNTETPAECQGSDLAVPGNATSEPRTYARPVHRVERDGEGNVTLQADIPGVPKENVTVGLEGGVLTVTARRPEAATPGGWEPIARELARPDYRLVLKIGGQLDADAVSAAVADGQLTLKVPVRESARRRSIEVN